VSALSLPDMVADSFARAFAAHAAGAPLPGLVRPPARARHDAQPGERH